MKQAGLLPLLYDAQATGGWTAGMVRVTMSMLRDVPLLPGDVVIEAGCGLGAVARTLQAVRPATRVIGLELHPLALARARGGERPDFVQGDLLQLPFPGACANLLLALDSFDQVGVGLPQALEEAHRVLLPGGLILLRVSAHPRLQGAHDIAFNTGRRYTRAETVGALADAGFAIKRTTYANLLLAPPTVALRLLGPRLDGWRGEDHDLAHLATSIYAAPPANAAVHAALALESMWLRKANLPTGLSLLVLAAKQGTE